MSLSQQLVDTWVINERINQYLLEEVAPEHLGSHSASKGRSVGEQLAHIHNVRLMWLKSADPERLEGLEKIEKRQSLDKALLARSLQDSGKAIAEMLKVRFDEDGNVKGFKPHAPAFLGYLVSHESHHRGQIVLSLKQAGHPVSRKAGFGLWEWGSRMKETAP